MLTANQFFILFYLKKGIITCTLEDLVSENNDLIVKQSPKSSLFTPTEVFLLMQVIGALPVQWCGILLHYVSIKEKLLS